jgi:hypothetical protein
MVGGQQPAIQDVPAAASKKPVSVKAILNCEGPHTIDSSAAAAVWV